MANDSSVSWLSFQWKPGLRYRFLDGVAITVVAAIVIAVVWPVYASEKHNLALSSGKECGVAVVMYSNDNDDRLPIAARWMDSLQPYVKNPSAFHSLAVKEPGQWGFAFRRLVSARPIAEISTPPNTLATVFDSIKTQWNANGNLLLLPRPSRYPGGNVVVFLDGHARMAPVGDKKVR